MLSEKIFMHRYLLPLCLMLVLSAQAQFTYVSDTSIPVSVGDGSNVPSPWGGGLNAAQFNTMDLDRDGLDDLVVFDRMADKVITFLQKNKQYVYAPEYESAFPEGVTNWLLLRDYNCDGRKDIFTGDILGIKVYTNITTGTTPAWKQVMFYAGAGSTSKSEVLLTKGFAGLINLQLQFDDLPAIEDADGDGDLDIFAIRFVGNGTIEYHQNFSQENMHGCDSLTFQRMTQKWAGVTECSCGTFAFNDADCNTGGRVQHAGGKSLLMLHANGDAAPDIVLSEAACNKLSLLTNEGTLSSPVVNTHTDFPAGTPVNITIYPAAFYEDVDFDGVRDLIASSNEFTKTIVGSDLSSSCWYYQNTGTNSAPAFTLKQRNFLQETMLDHGDNAVPAFLDYDADGDNDLFVSQNNYPATIYVYENTGTAEAPAFRLASKDFLGLSLSYLYNMRIQFADINHDGTSDLVFTATNSFNGVTNLYYVLNQSSSGINFSGQTLQTANFAMVSTENVCIVDVDGDGKSDLLAGRSNGALQYWKNSGGATPAFSLQDDTFLGITSSVLRQNLSCAIGDLDADGRSDLVLGDQTGILRIVSDFREATDESTATSGIIYNKLLDIYEAQNLGGRLWPVVVNLFNTNKPAIVVGNTLGGLRVLRNDDGAALGETPTFDIYPNPIARHGTIRIRSDRRAQLQVYSALGQAIGEATVLPANDVRLLTADFAPGVYIFRFAVNNKYYARRVVVYE